MAELVMHSRPLTWRCWDMTEATGAEFFVTFVYNREALCHQRFVVICPCVSVYHDLSMIATFSTEGQNIVAVYTISAPITRR